ncbi:hypothetical protein V8B97DRAFT_2020251 [Scleroderma yunnanense]
MGIKRLFSHLIRRLKPKKHVEDHPVIVDVTNLDVPQVISTESNNTFGHATELSGSPMAIVPPTSTQLVLWQPPASAIPPFLSASFVDTFRGRVSPTLVQTVAALALGFLPTIATQALLTQHFSSFWRSSCLERDLMFQRFQESANIAATLKRIFGGGVPNSQNNETHEEPVYPAVLEVCHLAGDPVILHLALVQKIPPGAYGLRQPPAPPGVTAKQQLNPVNAFQAQEIRYLTADPALVHLVPMQKILPGASEPQQLSAPLQDAAKQQANQGSAPGASEIRCLAADPALAHLAPMQKIPPGAYGPRQPIAPPACVPSLAWSGRTAGTSEISTPQAPHPDLRVPPKKVPRYPPGLGFPSEQVYNVAKLPTPVVIPTQLIRANKPNLALVLSERFASNAATCGHSEDVTAEDDPEYDYEDADASDARYEKYTVSIDVVSLQVGMYKYKFTGTIGRGGNGTVWFGEGMRDDGPPMDVAIKVINRKRFFSTWASDKEFRQMSSVKGKVVLEQRLLEAGGCISTEFSAWLRITFENHPFLTPLIDCFSDEKNVYFAMRYYPENLRQRVSNKACKPQLWQIRLIVAELRSYTTCT